MEKKVILSVLLLFLSACSYFDEAEEILPGNRENVFEFDDDVDDKIDNELIVNEEIKLYKTLEDQLIKSNSYLKMIAFTKCYKCYSNIDTSLNNSCIHTLEYIKHIESCDGKCDLKDCLFYKAKLNDMDKCKCLNRNCSSCSSVKINIFNRSHDDLTKISGITVN